jgi:integrase
MRLTVKNVEAMRPGAERREIPDAHMPGLYLVLQPSGAKSWAVRYRHRGASRKHTVGSFPAVDLKTARALGGKALRAVAEGRDPGREKAEARSVRIDSVDRIVEEFLERHVRRSNRARTQEETERLFRLHILARWRGRMVRDINRRDVIDMVDRVVDGGSPVAANRALTVVKTFFNWCVARDILTASPAQGVKPPTAEKSRDRVLDDTELKLVWEAAGRVGYPFGTMTRLLIATGQRRDEVAKMRWEEVDFERRLWTLPRERVKADRPHEVPLSTIALDILKAVPRLAGSPYVLTTNGAAPSSGFAKNKKKLDGLLPADMPSWRLHDLRRTCASGMARLGINLPVIEKVLNHSSGSFAGIVAVYQRHDFADEKRHALEAWGNFVEALVEGKPASKVVRLREKRP